MYMMFHVLSKIKIYLTIPLVTHFDLSFLKKMAHRNVDYNHLGLEADFTVYVSNLL